MTCTHTEQGAVRERHYPSDTTDAEWAVLEPRLPPPACCRPMGGRPEKHPCRNVVFTDRRADRMRSELWRCVADMSVTPSIASPRLGS
jgi:transposase